MLVTSVEDPITARGAQGTLSFLNSKDHLECTVHVHKQKDFNDTLLNKCCPTFDQCEKIRRALIQTPESKFTVGSAEPIEIFKCFTGISLYPNLQCRKGASFSCQGPSAQH